MCCVRVYACPRSFPKDGDLPLQTRGRIRAGCQQEQPGVPGRSTASPLTERREDGRRPLRPAGPGTGPRPPLPPAYPPLPALGGRLSPSLAPASHAGDTTAVLAPGPHGMRCTLVRSLRPRSKQSGRRGKGRERQESGRGGHPPARRAPSSSTEAASSHMAERRRWRGPEQRRLERRRSGRAAEDGGGGERSPR